MTKTKLEALMELSKINWTSLARETKVSTTTLRDANARPLDTWSVRVVSALAKYFEQTPGDFLNYLQGYSRINGVEINEIDQTIQGVKIDNKMQFKLMINILENNLNLGYLPTKEDVEYLLNNWKKVTNEDLEKVHQQFLEQCKMQLVQINLQNK